MDREVGDLLRRFEDSRWAGLSGLVERLGDLGVLSPELDAESGTVSLALMTGFQSYDQLSVQMGHLVATPALFLDRPRLEPCEARGHRSTIRSRILAEYRR